MSSPSSSGYSGGIDAGDTIKVSFGGLAQGASDIGRSASMIEQHLADLKRDLTKLTADWTGTAADTYQEHQRNWDQAAADLKQVLASIGTAVARASEDYADGERTNAGRWA
jgi:early secretory antigenic target protein ESAT-6